MIPPRQQPQHALRIASVARLAENVPVDHDNRVGTQDALLGPGLCHCQRLFPRQTLGTLTRRFAFAKSFLNVSGLRHKRNARVAQKFLPAWRRGSQYQHALRF
jgi:hypothetical protein